MLPSYKRILCIINVLFIAWVNTYASGSSFFGGFVEEDDAKAAGDFFGFADEKKENSGGFFGGFADESDAPAKGKEKKVEFNGLEVHELQDILAKQIILLERIRNTIIFSFDVSEDDVRESIQDLQKFFDSDPEMFDEPALAGIKFYPDGFVNTLKEVLLVYDEEDQTPVGQRIAILDKLRSKAKFSDWKPIKSFRKLMKESFSGSALNEDQNTDLYRAILGLPVKVRKPTGRDDTVQKASYFARADFAMMVNSVLFSLRAVDSFLSNLDDDQKLDPADKKVEEIFQQVLLAQITGALQGFCPTLQKILQKLGEVEGLSDDVKKVFVALRRGMEIERNQYMLELAESELGMTLSILGKLGAATIAQTTRADFQSEEVAVKFVRPFLDHFYRQGKKMLHDLVKDYGIGDLLVEKVEKGVESEMDMVEEFNNIENVAKHFNLLATELRMKVRAIETRGAGASRKVLVMQLAHGQAVSEILERREVRTEHGGEAKKYHLMRDLYHRLIELYELICHAALHTPLGIYHGDLHPGNLIFDPETGILWMIDWGNAGECNHGETNLVRSLGQAFLAVDIMRSIPDEVINSEHDSAKKEEYKAAEASLKSALIEICKSQSLELNDLTRRTVNAIVTRRSNNTAMDDLGTFIKESLMTEDSRGGSKKGIGSQSLRARGQAIRNYLANGEANHPIASYFQQAESGTMTTGQCLDNIFSELGNLGLPVSAGVARFNTSRDMVAAQIRVVAEILKDNAEHIQELEKPEVEIDTSMSGKIGELRRRLRKERLQERAQSIKQSFNRDNLRRLRESTIRSIRGKQPPADFEYDPEAVFVRKIQKFLRDAEQI